MLKSLEVNSLEYNLCRPRNQQSKSSPSRSLTHMQDPFQAPKQEDLLLCTPSQTILIPGANSLASQLRNPLITSTHLLELTLIGYQCLCV